MIEPTTRRDPNLSAHAVARMVEMDVGPAQIIEVLVDPEIEYSQNDYDDTHRIAQRGDLSVCFVADEHGVTVVTVLPRTEEEYER